MIVRCYGVVNGHSIEFKKVPGTENQFSIDVPWTSDLQDMTVYMVNDQGKQAEFKYSGLVEEVNDG